MATIKDGYAGKPFELRIHKGYDRGIAEIWTEFTKPDTLSDEIEVLHYATLQELVDLRDEINAAIKEMAGV